MRPSCADCKTTTGTSVVENPPVAGDRLGRGPLLPPSPFSCQGSDGRLGLMRPDHTAGPRGVP